MNNNQLTHSDLNKIDKKGMFKIYDEWPEIAKKSYNSNLEIVDFENVRDIIFVGMGGSGAIGDLFSAILSKQNIHVNVVKGYLLPKTTNSNSLVIATSISGNTIETLTAIKSAKKIGCKILGLSSGGIMEQLCKKEKIQYRQIEKYHSPRASFVSFLYSMIKILDSQIPIKENEIKNSIRELEITRKNISSNNLKSSNKALNLANFITGIPVIYYPWGLQTAAIRFKNTLQENSKIHAIAEDVVEASHNGIVSWERKINANPIFIQGVDDYIKTKQRWKIFEKYFNSKKIKFKKINSVEGDILSKLTNLIYQLDYTSLYLAIIKKVDPTPVKSIEYIKKLL